MTINRLDERRVLVVLADSDMSDFALNFAEMGMDNAHSRLIILRLTKLACRKTGIDTRGKRLSVEALAVEKGCYLLVTVKRIARRYRLKRGGGVCFSFEGCSEFLGAVEAAYRSGFMCAKNAAYVRGGVYYLLFGYPALPKALRGLLSEFGKLSGGALKCAQIREHARVICPRKAISVIGEKLC